MLIKFVSDSVQRLLTEGADVISRLVMSRNSCEKWLQIEAFKRLIRQFPDLETAVEHAYPSADGHCDLWCRETDGHESWVELKTCVTNYEGVGGRPITQQIAWAIADLNRLGKLPLGYERHLFLLAYPMPASGIQPQWSAHLDKFRPSGGTVIPVLTAPVCFASRTAAAMAYTISPLT